MANAQDNHTDESSGQDSEKSGVFGGIANKLSSSMGAGQGNADDQGYLSQGITAVQQSVFGQTSQPESGGENASAPDQKKQDIHAAVDQAHPEKISEFMRDKYMSRTAEMNKEEGRS